MKYTQTIIGKFVSRPNRFIAIVEVDGLQQVCHVKNTGRCRELLIPGTTVVLERSENSSRKTAYDLVSVYKGTQLVNIDSQAPNKVFAEWAKDGGFVDDLKLIKPESQYKNSRFDFYIETSRRKMFVEVKGVTLEENGVLMFPDAPTERGVKHLQELVDAHENGYESYIVFVVQMDRCRYFTPNRATHPEFADALIRAAQNGVNIIAVCCYVNEEEIKIATEVEVKLL